MSLSTIDKIDSLFNYLYQQGSAYVEYREIVKGHFKNDEETNDVQAMLIKLERDGYVDTGKRKTETIFEGWVEQTIYKLSFEGRFLYENSPNNKPYLGLKKKEKRKRVWEVVKIIAAVINALLVIGVAIWAALQSKK